MRRGFLKNAARSPASNKPANAPSFATIASRESVSRSTTASPALRGAPLLVEPVLASGEPIVFHIIQLPSGLVSSTAIAADTRDRLAPCLPTLPSFAAGLFEVRPTDDGRGLGMFATQDLSAGTTIVVEHPSVIRPDVMDLGQTTADSVFHRLVRALDRGSQEAFHQLANSYSEEVCSVSEGIFRTNAHGIELSVHDGEPDGHSAIFLQISRANHSCGPNARFDWNLTSFTGSVHAVRPIAAGEEVTVSYTHLLTSRDTRRARLRDSHLFECNCAFCCLPHACDIASSDQRRAELLKSEDDGLSNGFDVWLGSRKLSLKTFMESHIALLQLAEREGLESYGNVAYHTDAIMRASGALGDRDLFRTWAVKAKVAWLVEYGSARREWRSRVEDCARWLGHPESFPLWALFAANV